MTIYLCHSKNIDYIKLYESLEKGFPGQDFIFPYKESSAPVDSSKYLKTKDCDLLLAEVSLPSTGQGIEIGWADSSGIPIAFLYKKGSDVSRSLKYLSDKIIKYNNFDEMIQQLKDIINE